MQNAYVTVTFINNLINVFYYKEDIIELSTSDNNFVKVAPSNFLIQNV